MPDQFWRLSYAEWLIYSRGRQNAQATADFKAGLYFREMFALTYNIHRGEKDEALSGPDVLPLPGEKKKRAPRISKDSPANWSSERWAEYMARINMPARNHRMNSTPKQHAHWLAAGEPPFEITNDGLVFTTGYVPLPADDSEAVREQLTAPSAESTGEAVEREGVNQTHNYPEDSL